MKHITRVIILFVLSVALFNLALLENHTFAFDMDSAAPNGMTPEKSRQTHQLNQIFKVILVSIPTVIIVVIIVRKLQSKKTRDSSQTKNRK